MAGQLHRLRSGVPLVRPPVQAGPAEGDGPVEEAPGQGRKHVVVDGRAAGAHAEQGDGGGVSAVVDDVLLNPSGSRFINLATLKKNIENLSITSLPPLDPTCRSFRALRRPRARGSQIC